MKIPAALKSGDKVAVVATAKRLEQPVEPGIEILESWGLVVEEGRNLHRQHGYFAGTDTERLADIQQVLNDPSIKAIIFARGGYGTTRVLNQIDFTHFKENPKWLVGFSDLTSILLQVTTLDIPVIHGTVCAHLGKDNTADAYLCQLLFGNTVLKYPIPKSTFTIPGSCSGKIVGGNLSLIVESIGAANQIDTKDSILFIEEIGEDKYRVDRMLNKLKRIGQLSTLTGVIVGSFSNIKDPDGYFTESIETLICNYFHDLNIPVAVGLKAGHEPQNLPLIMGLNAHIQVSQGWIEINYC